MPATAEASIISRKDFGSLVLSVAQSLFSHSPQSERMHMPVKPAVLVLSAFVITAFVLAQDRTKSPAKRATPPKFNSAEVSQVFFPDVFSKLQGARPATPTANAAPSSGATATVTPGGATTASGGAGGWSKLISSGTIEDEIKAIKLEVDKNVTTPSDFAGRGHKVIRREFSFLAMLFAVIAEYDGEVRFKKDAATARDLFSRTANNTKAGGNTNVFSEAKLRKGDLDELLNGSSLPAQPAGDTPEWGVIIERSPLMQRLEAIYQERVAKSLASKDEFGKHIEQILHDAEIISVMATVLTKPGMSDAEDQTYIGFANSMKSSAREIVDAVKLNNYDQARAAAGKIDKACSQCHEAFR